MTTVFLYGATGFTGGLVAHALAKAGHRLILSARDPARLEACAGELGGDVELRSAQIHDAAGLTAAMRDATVVVNCAGPFTKLAEPMVRAAIAVGASYLDTAGEQHVLRGIYERCEAAARHAGVTVVNGMAFEIALGDWAAALAASACPGAEPFDEIAVSYALSRFRPTRGTRLAMLDSVAGDGSVWSEDRWVPSAPAAERRVINFAPGAGELPAVSFPSGEVITVPRHVATRRVQTFLALEDAPQLASLSSLMSPVLGLLAKSPLGSYARALAGGGPAAPSELDRHHNRFAIVAEARRGFHRERVAISGRDIYGVTAELIALGVHALCTGAPAAGILAPAELADPDESLRALASRAELTVTTSF